MEYDITIGLEIHAEPNTQTKIFCGCKNQFSTVPNTNCCPVCLALPGALPMLSRAAVEKTIAAGLAMDCQINELAIFERKHYFYPDLSKAYQISQLVRPICTGGGITLKNGKHIRLNRIHLEEDAGKLLHNAVNQTSMVDCNRGGVPLNELVTEPDISSAAEAVEFLEEIRSRLIFANVAECRMEQGGMRCDVSISLKPAGSKTLGNRAEIKNLNSFKMVARAIEFEIKRQTEVLNSGGKVALETRRFDEGSGKTISMRSKEQEVDYRYFPDPDIYAVKITKSDIAKVRDNMPVLAYQLKEQFVTKFGLPEYDADVLTRSKNVAMFYLDCLNHLGEPKKVSNWIMVDLLKIMNDKSTETIPVSSAYLAEIIKMVEDKKITKAVGLQLLDMVIEKPQPPSALAQKMGLLVTITDAQILDILNALKKENPRVAEDFKSNKERVLRFIVGHVMKHTQGKAKSENVERLIYKTFE